MAFSLYREERARDSVSDNLAIRKVATVGSTRGLCSDCRLASHIGGVSTARAGSPQCYIKRHVEPFSSLCGSLRVLRMGHGPQSRKGGCFRWSLASGICRWTLPNDNSECTVTETLEICVSHFVLHVLAFGSNSGGTQSQTLGRLLHGVALPALNLRDGSSSIASSTS